MKKHFQILCLSLLFLGVLPAQVIGQSLQTKLGAHKCVTDGYHNLQMENDGRYKEKVLENEAYILNANAQRNPSSRNSNTYTIPVVVHVLHRGNLQVSQNLMSDSDIENAIQRLNDDFKGLATPTFGITDDTPPAIDTGIEFCLASEDPSGNPSTGITRTDASSVPDFSDLGISFENLTPGADANVVKDLSRWPTSDYLNIWLTFEVNDGNIGGYAQFPNGGDYDGVTISYFFFEGSVLTHEVGHWLNLLHVFEGDANGTQCPENTDCTTQGDRVCDTPPFRRVECITATCSSEPEVYNSSYSFMGYCESIISRFTQGQTDRMIATLDGPIRSTLAMSSGCSGTINPPVDNDNDGFIASEDCDDNDPSIPTVAGTLCNDGNNNTDNDVIQSDGCSCTGTPISNVCNVSVSSSNGSVTITGMTSNSNSKIFDSNIISVWQCNPWTGSPCSASENVTGLNVGETYYVSVESDVCQEWIPVVVEGGGSSGISIVCPSDITLAPVPGNLVTLNWPIPTANTDCNTGGLNLTQISGPPLGTQFLANNSTYTIVYEATDNCGNTTTCSFTVTEQVFNSTIEFSFCPADINVVATSADGAIVTWPTPTVSTNCSGGGSISQSTGLTSGSLFPIGTTEVVFQGFANGCNATTACVFNITVTEQNNTTCNVSVSSSNGSVTITGMTSNSNSKIFDSNIISVWQCNPWTGSPCSASETITGLNVGETYYVSVESDVCQEWIPVVVEGGGSSGISIVCPSDITLAPVPGNLVTLTWPIPTANTDCNTGGLDLTQISGPPIGTQFLADNSTYTIVYEATDNCGNTSTCSFTVTEQVFNSTIEFTFCPADINIVATSADGAIVTWPTPTVSTNCTGGGSISQSTGLASGSLFPVGTTEVVFQGFANGCNANTACVFNVTVTEQNNTTCNVSVSSSNGAVTITGMTSNSNTKIFDSNIISVWKCNPWTGSPCSNSETIEGLNVGETYYVSVVSDVCQEWIPVVVEDGSNFRYSNEVVINQGDQRKMVLNKLYPLPAEDYIILDISSEEVVEFEAIVYDARGSLVDQKIIHLTNGTNLIEWDISQLPSGFYQILINSGRRHEPIRFLKQRL